MFSVDHECNARCITNLSMLPSELVKNFIRDIASGGNASIYLP